MARDVMANVWMHNGFLQVEGQKMSKSEGNFVTIHELLDDREIRRPQMAGRSAAACHADDALSRADRFFREAAGGSRAACSRNGRPARQRRQRRDAAVMEALADDLNTVAAIQALHALAQAANADPAALPVFAASAALLASCREG